MFIVPPVLTALHGGAQRKEMFIKITLMFVFIPHSSVHPAWLGPWQHACQSVRLLLETRKGGISLFSNTALGQQALAQLQGWQLGPRDVFRSAAAAAATRENRRLHAKAAIRQPAGHSSRQHQPTKLAGGLNWPCLCKYRGRPIAACLGGRGTQCH